MSPANTDAAFLDASIESLVVPLGLPIYDGYDGLDYLQLTFLTLLSGETVTLASYLNSPQPGTSIHVDSAMQNIPQVIFESCQQLQVSREEAIWFHPDWQDEIDRLYVEHGNIEKRPELSQLEELPQQNQYEPIDCFNHALRIYTRQYVPATYWAMLQHNLGLAYQNRIQGDRGENLKRSIECFIKSLEVYNRNEFPDKRKKSQANVRDSLRLIRLLQNSSDIDMVLSPTISTQHNKSAIKDDKIPPPKVSIQSKPIRKSERLISPSSNRLVPRGKRGEKLQISNNNTIAKPESIVLMGSITVRDLAKRLLVTEIEVIKQLFFKGITVSVTQILDVRTAAMISNTVGVNVIPDIRSVEQQRMTSHNGTTEFTRQDLIDKRSAFDAYSGDRYESKKLDTRQLNQPFIEYVKVRNIQLPTERKTGRLRGFKIDPT